MQQAPPETGGSMPPEFPTLRFSAAHWQDGFCGKLKVSLGSILSSRQFKNYSLASGGKYMARYRKNLLVIVGFLAPAFLLYFIFEAIPVISSFWFAFNEWEGIANVPLKFVGINNFKYLFHSEQFLTALKNVLVYVVISVLTQVPIGYFLAFILNNVSKGMRFFKTAFFIPNILPMTSVGLLWYFILMPNHRGLLNKLLTVVGLKGLTHQWLVDTSTAFGWIIAVTTWCSIGLYMIIGMAALAGVPEEVVESGLLDGATGWKKVFYILVPMIWESVKISVIMVITGVLKFFDLIYVMTGGGPNGATHVPASLLYDEAFKYNHYGAGSAISVVIFMLSISFTVISLRAMRNEKLDSI